MIIDNVMYHNIDSVKKTPQGLRVCRFSEDVMAKVNPHARYMASYACNTEIRFVTDAKTCFVSLLSEEGNCKVDIFYGDYAIGERILETGKITRLNLTVPDPVDGLNEEFYKNNKFKFGVWRLHFHNSVLTVCDIDTLGHSIRPPKAEELPEKTMLSYGSSISHGSGAVHNPLSYVNTLANLLGVDCLAKGVGGSCFAEKELADSFAARSDWDFALLEIGVNMIGSSLTIDEFKDRFEYMADKMYQTGKKLVFVTIFPWSALYNDNCTKEQERYRAFNDIIRNKYSEFEKKQVLLIEGTDVLTSTEMLSADGIHPSSEGHVKMGFNLYEKVKEFLK